MTIRRMSSLPRQDSALKPNRLKPVELRAWLSLSFLWCKGRAERKRLGRKRQDWDARWDRAPPFRATPSPHRQEFGCHPLEHKRGLRCQTPGVTSQKRGAKAFLEVTGLLFFLHPRLSLLFLLPGHLILEKSWGTGLGIQLSSKTRMFLGRES